jgi:hypothetical protein
MARRRQSIGEQGLRLLAEIVVLIVGAAFVLSLLSGGFAKQTGSAIASNMFANLGASAPSPPPGTAWTAADGQACHAAYDAVSGWPGKSGTIPIDVVMYSGSSDVKAARQAALTAAKAYLARSAALSVPAASFEIGAFRSSLSDLATAVAQPMTVPDFRTKYQRPIDTLSGIRTRCVAIDQWVHDHVPQ